MTDSKRVHIFDTTLRDAEQTPGASLTVKEKLEIAQQLSKLRVDVIEAGFPISSNEDFVKGNFDTNFRSENFSEWNLNDVPLEAIASALLSSKSSSAAAISNDEKLISSPWNQKGHWRQGL